MGKLLQLELDERLEAGLATLGFAWQRGASIFRVHDVAASKRYFAMFSLLCKEGLGEVDTTVGISPLLTSPYQGEEL